jgi:hypothetical protein
MSLELLTTWWGQKSGVKNSFGFEPIERLRPHRRMSLPTQQQVMKFEKRMSLCLLY